MTESIRVLVADDHVVVRQALRVLLERESFKVVGEAGNGLEATRMARDLSPEVAVLDLVMPVLNGLEAAREIQQASPATRTVLLTSRTDPTHVLEALRAGCRACILKTHDVSELSKAIREVARGGTYLGRGASGAVVEAYLSKKDLPPDPLTPRERQVLQLIAEGHRTRHIAELLGVSIKTIESHRERIMRKLEIREVAGLVRYAIKRGLSEL